MVFICIFVKVSCHCIYVFFYFLFFYNDSACKGKWVL